MKRHPYYPWHAGEQSAWHTNLATKLPGDATLLGLSQAEEDRAVADDLTLAYGLGGWIVAGREYGTSCTQNLETRSFGTGSANYAFPSAQLPGTADAAGGDHGGETGGAAAHLWPGGDAETITG